MNTEFITIPPPNSDKIEFQKFYDQFGVNGVNGVRSYMNEYSAPKKLVLPTLPKPKKHILKNPTLDRKLYPDYYVTFTEDGERVLYPNTINNGEVIRKPYTRTIK